MESRFNTATESFSAIKGDRRSFGGYGSDYSRATQYDETGSIETARSMLGIDRTYPTSEDDPVAARRTLYGDRPMPETAYTEPPRADEPEESRGENSHLFVGKAFGESAFAPSRTFDEAVLKPSETTMQYEQYEMVENFLDEEDARAPSSAVRRTPMTKKQKITIAIYSSIVAIVAALIILTGAMIGAVSAGVKGLKADADAAQGAYRQSVERVAEVESEEFLRTEAEKLGMTDNAPSTQLTLVPETEVKIVTAPTNGFDRFCDWMTKVFG